MTFINIKTKSELELLNNDELEILEDTAYEYYKLIQAVKNYKKVI